MAGSDIYSRASQNLGGTFAVDAASMEFSSVSPATGAADGGGAVPNFGVGMITQNVSIQYQQQINRLYEVGSNNNTYLIGGRTSGNLGIGRVIGPKVVAKAFYTIYGNLCNATNNQIDMFIQQACTPNDTTTVGPPTSLKYSCIYVVITAIGLTVGAQDMIFNEQLQMMFVSLAVA